MGRTASYEKGKPPEEIRRRDAKGVEGVRPSAGLTGGGTAPHWPPHCWCHLKWANRSFAEFLLAAPNVPFPLPVVRAHKNGNLVVV